MGMVRKRRTSKSYIMNRFPQLPGTKWNLFLCLKNFNKYEQKINCISEVWEIVSSFFAPFPQIETITSCLEFQLWCIVFHWEGIERASYDLVHHSLEPLLIVSRRSDHISSQDFMDSLVNFRLHILVQWNPVSLLTLNWICFGLVTFNSTGDRAAVFTQNWNQVLGPFIVSTTDREEDMEWPKVVQPCNHFHLPFFVVSWSVGNILEDWIGVIQGEFGCSALDNFFPLAIPAQIYDIYIMNEPFLSFFAILTKWTIFCNFLLFWLNEPFLVVTPTIQ